MNPLGKAGAACVMVRVGGRMTAGKSRDLRKRLELRVMDVAHGT